jgi:KaiC/GvpD/RAD55 family RecA-like ATPase
MENNVMKVLEEQKKSSILLFITSSRKYVSTNLKILDYLVNRKGLQGIYITVNRPYRSIKTLFEDNNINPESMFIIDIITKTVGGKEEDISNCIFLDSPANLTDLTISLHQAVEMFGDKEKFIFLDSLSTLLIYNKSSTISKFAHFLTGRMRLWNCYGVIISIERETDSKLISQLTQFCDATVRVE